MPANLLKPRGLTLVASAARAATGNSGTLLLPLGESYEFIVNTTAASGTSPTLDIAIQTTPDGGTTWFTAAKFTQIITTTNLKIRIQPTLGRGEAGSIATVADTGAAVNSNTILTRKIRVLYTIGGTNPSFTFAVYCIVVPKQAGTY